MVLAVLINGDSMSVVNCAGLVICLGGIISHVVHKLRNTTYSNGGNGSTFNKEYERHELSQSLMDNVEQMHISESDSEQSDSQTLFNILNSHDR